MTAHFFVDASLTDTHGKRLWWSARHIVAVDANQPISLADTTIEAVLVSDVDAVGSGLDETHGRYDADWCDRKPKPVAMSTSELLARVTEGRWADFREARAQYRIDHDLPRYVVRSDVRDKAAGGRNTLYALRHPWPAGGLMQGGTASRTIELPDAAETDLPNDAQIIERRDGTWIAVVSDQVFIEAFPLPSADNPSGGFMRGEGVTFADAEDALWARHTAKQTCPAVAATGNHRWEQRGYRNGAGFCGDCDTFGSDVFNLAEIGSTCIVCGVGTNWSHLKTFDDDGSQTGYDLVCRDHAPPDFVDIDAHFQRDVDDPPERPLNLKQVAAVEARMPKGVTWRDLDFDTRWRVAHLARRDMLHR